MKGFIVKRYWANLILSGEKTWEIRGSRCNIRGTVGILSEGKVLGTVDIVDCLELSLKEYQENSNEHRVAIGNSSFGDLKSLPYKKTFAWVMKNPVVFKSPKNYIHKKGCVIWVNL